MTYTTKNFKTKAELKRSVERGDRNTIFEPGPLAKEVRDGIVYLEGPHYPEPHKWYATATIVDGVITKVK